ncbi:stress protein, Gls24 family [Lentzea guizhouensis]|uniref:Stress protein, Gls24 family n=1 Tax=Lentzea guizhouensis TaxID=1586287 RepID=A0A1B2HE05_9PSEU|nr:Asp23/Gls24 family envelope stress response protein [Lentzea guizhouensis]ANZ35961.1 stress protein, Gls24 family [Lentzea guizhouensis]
MSESTVTASKSSGYSAPAQRSGSGKADLVSSHGTTSIADGVVQKIAGLSAREVPGVHGLGGGAARAFSAIRERIPGATASAGQGVSVEVGEKQAAVDLQIVVEYGVAITDVAQAIRRNVIGAVERMTGLEVVEVNIDVQDLHIPSDDEDEPTDNGRVK